VGSVRQGRTGPDYPLCRLYYERAPAARGPRSAAKFFTTLFAVLTLERLNVECIRRRLKGGRQFFGEKSEAPPEKVLATRTRKWPSLTFVCLPRMVNPALGEKRSGKNVRRPDKFLTNILSLIIPTGHFCVPVRVPISWTSEPKAACLFIVIKSNFYQHILKYHLWVKHPWHPYYVLSQWKFTEVLKKIYRNFLKTIQYEYNTFARANNLLKVKATLFVERISLYVTYPCKLFLVFFWLHSHSVDWCNTLKEITFIFLSSHRSLYQTQYI